MSINEVSIKKYIKTYPAKEGISNFIQIASVSGIIWRSYEIAAFSKLNLERPVLDLGCGDGRFAKLIFTEKLDYGLDVSKQSVMRAKKSNAYLHYFVADAGKIPLPDQSIQTVFSNSVFEHIENLNSVLSEISRILKPGGELIFTTHDPSSKEFFIAKLLRKIKLIPVALFYEKVFIKLLQLETVWDINTWHKKLSLVGIEVYESKMLVSPKDALFYEIFLPFAYLQNRFNILKKIPFTKYFFLILKPDFNQKINSGRNLFIQARKM